jgi:hypothetical protein
MDPEKTNPNNPENVEGGEAVDRRKTLIQVGKFAAYAAPFTVLALSKKAEAATGHGPGKH